MENRLVHGELKRVLTPFLPLPLDFTPNGPNKAAEGKGDARAARVAFALGRGGFIVFILFQWMASNPERVKHATTLFVSPFQHLSWR
jgi:hypothetical protein